MQIKRNKTHLTESVQRIFEILEKRESHKIAHCIYKDTFEFSGLELGFALIREVADA